MWIAALCFFLFCCVSAPTVWRHHAVSGQWGHGEGAEESSVQPQRPVWPAALQEHRPQGHQVGYTHTLTDRSPSAAAWAGPSGKNELWGPCWPSLPRSSFSIILTLSGQFIRFTCAVWCNPSRLATSTKTEYWTLLKVEFMAVLLY